MCLLLNRLGAKDSSEDDRFSVKMGQDSPQRITRPEELIAALEDSGHAVEVKISSGLTSFG